MEILVQQGLVDLELGSIDFMVSPANVEMIEIYRSVAQLPGAFVRSALTDHGVYLAGQFVFYLVYGSLLGTLAGLISGGAIIESVPVDGEPAVTRG